MIVLAVPAAALAFSFGRNGGNIRAYEVTIAATGVVHTTGPVNVRRHRLTRAQLAALERVVAQVRFGSLPQVTRCMDALPDSAALFVRTKGRTVEVHGRCVPRLTTLWNALAAAVKIDFAPR